MSKRMRNGQAKVSEAVKIAQGTTKPGKAQTSSRDLETEILALGGSKDDFALIEDAPSGSELEDAESTTIAQGLQRDLRQMVKELGIDRVAPDVGSDDPDVEMDQREDELTMGTTSNTNGKKTQFPVQSEWHAADLPALPTSLPTEPLPVVSSFWTIFAHLCPS